MKNALLSLALLTPVAANPPMVGTTPEDVAFARAADFSGGQFRTLTDTRLSDQPPHVQVFVYLTPW